MNLAHLSTSTPASEVSSQDFRDDMSVNESDIPSFDDILKNSPAAAILGIKQDEEESLPEDSEDVPTPEDSEQEEAPADSDDDENDLEGEQDQENSEEESKDEDDTSTQESELPSEEDIDWEYRVPVTVDGKTEYLTLEEIRKGFATDKHLSQKGRELGDLKKQIEQERDTKLNELVQLGTMLHEQVTSQETGLATEYHSISEQIKKAREEGDRYTVAELKEKQEEVQQQYWELRKKREEALRSAAHLSFQV